MCGGDTRSARRESRDDVLSSGMSVAEFEEKEFEGPLNGQLGLGGPLWSPGQVLEQLVGFDVAMLTQDMVFWTAQGFASPPQGAVVLPGWWPGALARLAVRVRRPPPFKMNVFLQHKRPEYLSKATATEWSCWKVAYFRFAITRHQQVALDACASALGQNGLVAYASPAFHSRVDLFTHVENRTLVANTHFAPAARLSGHARYSYVSASTHGVGHSDPVRIKPLTILNGGGSGDGPPGAPQTGDGGRAPADLLQEAQRAAQAAIAASPTLVGNERLFATSFNRAIALLQASGVETGDSVRNFVYASTFASMAGLRWHVLAFTAPARRSRT